LKFIVNILLVLLLCTTGALAQPADNNLQFESMSISAAISKARATGKMIFVDGYAPWCIPCKKMDYVFHDAEVSRYLSDNFINVKINMDSALGKEYSSKYGVVFLPTFLFLDTNGNIRVKIDRVLTKSEVLSYAKSAINSRSQIVENRPLSNNPFQTKKVKTSKPVVSKPTESTTQAPPANEKILYVLDDEAQMTPEILYQESYFRMQLMDGSHWETAEKYLQTQADWSSEKNMRFVFDFVRSTQTREFNYIIKNREKFNEKFGIDQVDRTVEILVYSRLNQGYPRPEREEATQLYTYAGVEDPNKSADKFLIRKNLDEGKYSSMFGLLSDYIDAYGPDDDKILNLYGEFACKRESKRKELSKGVEYLKIAIKQHPDNGTYHKTLANLYIQLNDKVRAQESIQNALKLLNQESADYADSVKMYNKIRKL
jgi:thiol-disulfide isomerase/thioredoxin